MAKRVGLLVAVALLAAGPASAQDAQAVLQAAADTMGVTDMMSIRYTGSGWVGATGQNFAPADDWPRFELSEYMRTIDFETESSTEEMVIRQGDYPARGGGGRADPGRAAAAVDGPRRIRLERRGRPGRPPAAGRRAPAVGDLPHPARLPEGGHGRR